MRKKVSMITSIMMLLILFSGCSKKEEEIDKTALKMDTVIRLKVFGNKASEAVEVALKRIDEIEQIASKTIASSDISKINNAAGKEYVKVHPEIVEMIKTAVKYSELSKGAFDITIGPLIELWGIGTEHAKVPTAEEITSLLPLVGYKNISINESDNSIKLLKEGMSIDLGGIAKGFAADEVIKILRSYKINSALISLGGSSIYTIGQKQNGSTWTVGIQHPRKDDNKELVASLGLSEQALATSGDYERYFMAGDTRYHHILNPATGYPTDNGVMSNTIIVDSSISNSNMLADILTKTVFVAGIAEGYKIIDSLQGVACLTITTDYKIHKSSNWKKDLKIISPEFEFK